MGVSENAINKSIKMLINMKQPQNEILYNLKSGKCEQY